MRTAINDFQWLFKNIATRPTRIAELVPLNPSALGFHDASGTGAGGVWFPTPDLAPRFPSICPGQPICWRYEWPQAIRQQLISDSNPHGSISINDLELTGGLIHLEVLAQHFDIAERTIVSKTDNLAAMFWQRKGSTTTNSAPAYLLRLFGMHQRVHRYVPRHDYQPGQSNPLADDASRLFDLDDSQFASLFSSKYPQNQPWNFVQPPSPLLSVVTSALQRQTYNVESALVVPPPAIPTGTSGPSTPINWASTPFSTPSTTKFQSSKSSSSESAQVSWLPRDVRSGLDQLKTTYGQLHRRTSPWGPLTHELMTPAT